jgi:hypothetical protein
VASDLDEPFGGRAMLGVEADGERRDRARIV